MYSRPIGRFALLVCDLQDRFVPLIFKFNTISRNSKYLMDCSKDLGIPVIVTEHYPEKLGYTIESLGVRKANDMANYCKIFEKKTFSMVAENDEVSKVISKDNIQNIVLCGIEAHICVLQTCLKLLSKHRVFVVADAVSSQKNHSRVLALEQMRQAGAEIVSAESIIYYIMETTEHPAFKSISNRTKNLKKENDEFGDYNGL